MALNPGSYARAAGLQSEINKVTITRVAGSEVQFRRTIDTYQKDLRYHVNQISREQKQLKRSMRKYSRKLQASRKERKQRQAKVKEDAERLKQQSESFRQAEEAVKRSSYVMVKPQADTAVQDDMQNTTGEATSSDTLHSSASASAIRTESGDNEEPEHSAVESHCANSDDKCENPQQPHKVFLTKSSLPYLQAKGREVSHQRIFSLEDENAFTLNKTSDVDQCLPIIDEEGKGSGDPSSDKLTKAESLNLSDDQFYTLAEKPSGYSAKIEMQVQTVSITSLNTKVLSRNGKVRGDNSVGAEGCEAPSSRVSLPALGRSVEARARRGARKSGVSFGDLIKLQHMPSSSTKRLFSLVDRLASKHGIKDLPHAADNAGPVSLDPRSNQKMKMARHHPESQLPDGIVRQAAILYSMKYGYRVDDNAFYTDTLPPILPSTSEELSSHPDAVKADSVVTKLDIMPRSPSNANDVQHPEDSVSDVTVRKLSSLSFRHESVDLMSTISSPSEAKLSAIDDNTPAEIDHSLDTLATVLHRHGHVPPMSELRRHSFRIRERAGVAEAPRQRADILDSPGGSLGLPATTAQDTLSQSARKVSPLLQRSRPRSRSRRDYVSNQLQKRLASTQQGNGGPANMAWQSAFGRLKLVHTLRDLSQHFHRDGN